MLDRRGRHKWQGRLVIAPSQTNLVLNITGELPEAIAIDSLEHVRDPAIASRAHGAKILGFGREHCDTNVNELLRHRVVNVAQNAEAICGSHTRPLRTSSANSAACSLVMNRSNWTAVNLGIMI